MSKRTLWWFFGNSQQKRHEAIKIIVFTLCLTSGRLHNLLTEYGKNTVDCPFTEHQPIENILHHLVRHFSTKKSSIQFIPMATSFYVFCLPSLFNSNRRDTTAHWHLEKSLPKLGVILITKATEQWSSGHSQKEIQFSRIFRSIRCMRLNMILECHWKKAAWHKMPPIEVGKNTPLIGLKKTP